jgi:putative transposase
MYPNQEQKAVLEEILGVHCRVYNTLLEEHKRRYDTDLPSYGFKLMCKDLTVWRAAIPALNVLNAQSLQVTAKRVALAFQSFFRRVAEGAEEPGYPRFKSFNRYPGWGYKTHGDGWRFFEGYKRKHSFRLSGIGDINLRGKGRFTGVPKTCEIINKQGKWYLSVTFNVDPAKVARTPGKETAAFDWGLTKLLTIAKADGTIEEIDNPRMLRNKLAALKKLQQAVSAEETKGKVSIGLAPDEPIPKGIRLPVTPKLKRLYKQVTALHSKIARQRHDFYHKLSALLISRFGFLATEELAVKKMAKRPEPIQDAETGEYLPNGANQKSKINRNIHDAAPATLLNMIRTKAEEAGSWFGLADTKLVKPTQRCHRCGTLVKKELFERWHTCPECYCHCGRDENAARTILRWHLEGIFWLGTSQADGLKNCQSETLSIAV